MNCSRPGMIRQSFLNSKDYTSLMFSLQIIVLVMFVLKLVFKSGIVGGRLIEC